MGFTDPTEAFACSYHQRRSLKGLLEVAREIVEASERAMDTALEEGDPFTANTLGWNLKAYKDFITWVESEEQDTMGDATAR